MADATYNVLLEMAVGSLTDVSSLVNRVSFDRALAMIDRKATPDHMMVEFLASAGAMSPLRGASGLLPGRLVKLTGTYSGNTYPLFYGRVVNSRTQPRVGDNHSTVVEVISDMDRLTRTLLTSSLFTGLVASSLFCEIMSLSNVTSFACVGSINDVIPYASYTDTPASDALQELVEAGNYSLFIDGAGVVRLRSRYAGMFDAALATHDTFYDMSYEKTVDGVINSLKFNSGPKTLATAPNTVAAISDQLLLPTGRWTGFWMTFQDPEKGNLMAQVGSMISQVSSQDYYASQNSGGGGLDKTSTMSITLQRFASTVVCSIYNSDANDIYLQRFQFRGYVVRALTDLGIKVDVSSSQTAYGVRALEISNALIGSYTYLRDLASTLAADRADPQEAVFLTLVNCWPGVLDYDAGDIVNVVNSATGVNSKWFITSMTHEITFAGGLRHEAQFKSEYFENKPWLVLDHATLGKLDSGRQLAV